MGFLVWWLWILVLVFCLFWLFAKDSIHPSFICLLLHFRKKKICFLILWLTCTLAISDQTEFCAIFLFMWIISIIKLLYSNCVIGALLVTLVEATQQMYLRTILFKQSFWGKKKKQSCFHSILRASLFGLCALGREACCW